MAITWVNRFSHFWMLKVVNGMEVMLPRLIWMELLCPQGVGIQLCTTWILNSPVELKDILKLKPYHQEISRDSCMECKMEDRIEF